MPLQFETWVYAKAWADTTKDGYVVKHPSGKGFAVVVDGEYVEGDESVTE